MEKLRIAIFSLLMLFLVFIGFAQIRGGFQYDNQGHINFVGYNTVGNDYIINVRVESMSPDKSIRKDIHANSGIKIGPNSIFGNWYWKKGDLVIITYPNNQCAMWECPETDKYYSGPTRVFTPIEEWVFITTSDGGRLGFYQILLEKGKRYIYFHDEYIEVPKGRTSFKLRNYTYYYREA